MHREEHAHSVCSTQTSVHIHNTLGVTHNTGGRNTGRDTGTHTQATGNTERSTHAEAEAIPRACTHSGAYAEQRGVCEHRHAHPQGHACTRQRGRHAHRPREEQAHQCARAAPKSSTGPSGAQSSAPMASPPHHNPPVSSPPALSWLLFNLPALSPHLPSGDSQGFGLYGPALDSANPPCLLPALSAGDSPGPIFHDRYLTSAHPSNHCWPFRCIYLLCLSLTPQSAPGESPGFRVPGPSRPCSPSLPHVPTQRQGAALGSSDAYSIPPPPNTHAVCRTPCVCCLVYDWLLFLAETSVPGTLPSLPLSPGIGR
mmetsp:Transcript_26506/g.42011  ORF Transcript_26506/g.42011 Transcript_26506/m.42011 type:complete len:313 (-) Transcript_26506:188-1126(-)